jgi:serine phosphatase RsbU (regulator of sigma subunit)
MCSSREFRRHTPVVYGKLNTKTNTFTYCNAGHDAGRYLSGSEFQVLDTGGVPLGLIEDEEYQEETLKLKNKDFITFYTDGVPDARNSQNESFGDEEVEKIIRSFIANPTEKGFTHKLKKKWYDFIGNTPLKDDSTLISIYHTPLDTK